MAVIETLPLSIAIRTLKGDERSANQLAKDAGISGPALSRICSGQYKPSPETLRKLASAKPCNGVTYEALLRAAGYLDKRAYNNQYRIANDKADEGAEVTSRLPFLGGAIIETVLRSTDLFVKGLNVDELSSGPDQFMPDLAIALFSANPPKKRLEWWFDLQWADYNASYRRENFMKIRQVIASYVFAEFNASRKLSLVLSDEWVFERLRGLSDGLALNGELSVVLMDKDLRNVKDEICLAHYNGRVAYRPQNLGKGN